MVPAVKIFLDTSVLIEYIKGNKTEFLDYLFSQNVDCCINHIVDSEFIYIYLGLMSGKSPMSLREAAMVSVVLNETEPYEFIQGFEVLTMDEEILTKSYEIMKKYDFLPNDAIILSTCLRYKLRLLGSFDSDFTKACSDEGILLIDDVNSLKKLITEGF